MDSSDSAKWSWMFSSVDLWKLLTEMMQDGIWGLEYEWNWSRLFRDSSLKTCNIFVNKAQLKYIKFRFVCLHYIWINEIKSRFTLFSKGVKIKIYHSMSLMLGFCAKCQGTKVILEKGTFLWHLNIGHRSCFFNPMMNRSR